jgi:hypothetical protein
MQKIFQSDIFSDLKFINCIFCVFGCNIEISVPGSVKYTARRCHRSNNKLPPVCVVFSGKEICEVQEIRAFCGGEGKPWLGRLTSTEQSYGD